MSWTDNDIDKLFQDGAGKASFEYKPEYWEEFSASLPVSASASNMTDEEVDALFQTDAEKSSISYKQEYWEEFAASLPIIVPTEEVTDAEVDALYREEAQQLSFKYKHSYWEEMAALLKSRRRPDFLWFGFSGVFALALIYGILSPQAPLGTDIDFVSELPKHLNLTKTQPFTAENSEVPENHIQKKAIGVSHSNKNIENESNLSTVIANNTPNNTINSSNANNQHKVVAVDEPANKTGTSTKETVTPIKKKQSAQSLLTVQEIISPNVRKSKFDSAPSRLEVLSISSELETGTLAPWNPTVGRNDARFGIYVQGLGGLSQSSITPSEFMSNSFGIGTGLSINKRNWTFSLGTNVIVENYNDLVLTRSAKVYGFGSDLYKFDLLYKHLYVTELDFSVGYNLGRHRFNFGVRPSFAFSSEVDINETSVTSYQGEFIENGESRTKVYGFMEGVNRFGVKPMVGYAFNFRGNWTLGANIGMELLPAINEEFINGSNNRAPLDGQLYIRKNFNIRK